MSESDNTHAEAIAALQAEIERLKADVARLQASLDSARGRISLTMRGQKRCPACGCQRIAHAQEVLDRGDGDKRAPMALFRPHWWSGKVVGEVEAYACTRCGLLEWYVKEPGTLTENEKYMRILEGPGEGGTGSPYR